MGFEYVRTFRCRASWTVAQGVLCRLCCAVRFHGGGVCRQRKGLRRNHQRPRLNGHHHGGGHLQGDVSRHVFHASQIRMVETLFPHRPRGGPVRDDDDCADAGWSRGLACRRPGGARGRREKVTMKPWAFAVFLLVAADPLITSAAGSDSLHQTLGPLPDFKLTDQNGNTVQREQLLGKVSVVSVFFSCCAKVCPATQQAMAGLQEKLTNYPDVLLISVNIFPEHDTPDIIAQYAQSRMANPERWLFLHGGEKEIYSFVQDGLKQSAVRNTSAPAGYEVDHTPFFMVIDHRGVIRGYVNGTNAAEVDELEGFVKQLVLAKFLPSVNAGLNATCGLLLILGFVMIRVRFVLAHKVCMLT